MPMSLAQRFAPNFSGQSRHKGRGVALEGRVTIENAGPARVSADVRGTVPYRAEIALDATRVRATCTCPHFGEGHFCKHLWGTLVAAEQQGHLRDLQAADPAWLPPGSPATGGDEPRPPDEPLPEDEPIEALLSTGPAAAPASPRAITWQDLLAGIRKEAPAGRQALRDDDRQILYGAVVSAATDEPGSGFRIALFVRQRKQDGTWGRAQLRRFFPDEIARLPDPADRHVLQLMTGGGDPVVGRAALNGFMDVPLNPAQVSALLPDLCRTGRFHRAGPSGIPDDDKPLAWDEGDIWTLRLRLRAGAGPMTVWGSLERHDDRMDLAEPDAILAGGILLARNRVARYRFDGPYGWIDALRRNGRLRIPKRDLGAFLEDLYDLPGPVPVELPATIRPDMPRLAPSPRLRLTAARDRRTSRSDARLNAQLSFIYGNLTALAADPRERIYDRRGRRVIVRDAAAESEARALLAGLGFRPPPTHRSAGEADFELPSRRMPETVAALVARGWRVEAEDGVYRAAGPVRVSVRSGVDWFDLEGGVAYDGQVVPFPRLLQALHRGDRFVRLKDGALGVLPEEWLRRQGLVLEAAEAEGDVLRYRPGQALLLDALLASGTNATGDAAFHRLRDRLHTFERIAPLAPPPTFRGTLRPYQQTGLGWLEFLRDFGLGGCLADDMGLGKTVQMLAHLESLRLRKAGPSLVVVPRSLLFNWKAEAARFAPGLRILEHAGTSRARNAPALRDADVVLTTYGTLRRDAAFLMDIPFDCVVLDEAQAIKNASSATAKAARLLRGRQKLALSGTPVENHLGELVSLLEFLNPGMLGGTAVLRGALEAPDGPDEATRKLLARSLRPLLLRRTKEQVAPELPRRMEQTIYVDLDAAERRRYDELKEHYRQSLLGPSGDRSGGRGALHVLEALLRLRQAACHPGLIDPALRGQPSSKLETILEQAREVVEEGHKALVFSQFTSFLAILRGALDREKVVYEYLDGKTRDRAERVRRFQEDPACRLFLISLKAGGFDLNLTAAEHVFLLDPWWNPAVEAQAIDRTHRIGQTRPVFAFRLVARNTVEEKVIELQKSKRALADAILSADHGLLRDLTKEDLALLLS